jgi:hypothetical protein
MDESTHVEYHRVSLLAIIAFLLGITSSGALIGNVLLALPVVGLGVGLLAISKIHSSEGHYSGRALAQWGVFFSVLFGVTAVVRPPLFQEVVSWQSKTFAQSWLQLLTQGDSKQALKYVGMKTKGKLVPRDSQEKPNVEGDMMEGVILQNFCEQPIIQQLQAAGKQANIRYERTVVKPLPTDRQIGVVQIFSITGNDLEPQTTTTALDSPSQGSSSQGSSSQGSSSPAPLYVQLYLTRSHTTEGQPAVWFVNQWELACL